MDGTEASSFRKYIMTFSELHKEFRQGVVMFDRQETDRK